MLKYFHMMEQMPSSQDMYVSRVARKMKEAEKKEREAKKADKELLTDRIVERVGEIVKGLQANEAQFARASDFTEKLAVTEHMFELQGELQKLRNIYDQVLKPSREELMHGDEPISEEDQRLIEKETPILLVGGKKPLRDDAETGVEMEVEDQDVQELTDGGTVIEERNTEANRRVEPLGAVPLYRNDEESIPAMVRPKHLADEAEPVMLTKRKSKKETTGTKTRVTPEFSEEHVDVEAIDRKAMEMSPRKRQEYYKEQRDKVLETLSNVLAHPTERSEQDQEQLVGRLESRFQVLQGRLNRAKSTPDRNDIAAAA